MMNLKIYYNILFGICLWATAQAQNPAGKVYVMSQCASGGSDYYFYDDNSFISKCWGCEATNLIEQGTWAIADDKVVLQIKKTWIGKPSGAVIPPCGSVCLYDKYTAELNTTAREESFDLAFFADEETRSEGPVVCGVWYFDAKRVPNDPHRMLRNNFVGKYPQGSERLLSEVDFKGLTRADLKIMRNEIFARYGYIFKTKDMADYFGKQKGYHGTLDNVDAFLSDIELKNVALIKKYDGNF